MIFQEILHFVLQAIACLWWIGNIQDWLEKRVPNATFHRFRPAFVHSQNPCSHRTLSSCLGYDITLTFGDAGSICDAQPDCRCKSLLLLGDCRSPSLLRCLPRLSKKNNRCPCLLRTGKKWTFFSCFVVRLKKHNHKEELLSHPQLGSEKEWRIFPEIIKYSPVVSWQAHLWTVVACCSINHSTEQSKYSFLSRALYELSNCCLFVILTLFEQTLEPFWRLDLMSFRSGGNFSQSILYVLCMIKTICGILSSCPREQS